MADATEILGLSINTSTLRPRTLNAFSTWKTKFLKDCQIIRPRHSLAELSNSPVNVVRCNYLHIWHISRGTSWKWEVRVAFVSASTAGTWTSIPSVFPMRSRSASITSVISIWCPISGSISSPATKSAGRRRSWWTIVIPATGRGLVSEITERWPSRVIRSIVPFSTLCTVCTVSCVSTALEIGRPRAP